VDSEPVSVTGMRRKMEGGNSLSASFLIGFQKVLEWEGFSMPVWAKIKKLEKMPHSKHFSLKGPKSENLKKII